MKSKLISAVILLVNLCASAQLYTTVTNLSATNFFAAASTYTYGGSNYVDMSYNTQLGLQFDARGLGDSSNTTVTCTFKLSRDHTNWFPAPFALRWYAQGTNLASSGTNVDVGAFPYVKLDQVTSTVTNGITNSTVCLWAMIKGYRRDE